VPIVFLEKSGKTHHLPLRQGSTPDELLAAYHRLGVVHPCEDVRVFFGPDEKEWVETLIKQASHAMPPPPSIIVATTIRIPGTSIWNPTPVTIVIPMRVMARVHSCFSNARWEHRERR